MTSNSTGDTTEAKQPPWNFRRIIPSDTSIGSALINELIDAMLVRDWPAAEQFRVQLAYEEAIVNAIRHGNRNDPDKKVTVEFSCDYEKVQIQIDDEGAGFDPQKVPDPRSEELLEVPGGRGVLLINEIMSEVNYNKKGNQITMTKVKGDTTSDD